jgi:NAD+ diphosphatase
LFGRLDEPKLSTPLMSPPPAAARLWFLVHPKGIVVAREDASERGEPSKRVRLPSEAEVDGLGIAKDDVHDVGMIGDARAMAAAVDGPSFLSLPAPFLVAGLRDLFGGVSEEVFGYAGRATQIVDWAKTHRFCGRCGALTERVAGERCMRCPSCSHLAYPRITPAIIVLVRRGDEALLARGARFPLPFYSTLAGFSEVGESLEETLAREVREEVGVEVKNIRYFGSQPWPFPNSLMVGFLAEWAGGEIRIDGKEILDAHWYRADALPTIPPKISIARRLIDAWVEDVRGGR